MEEPKRYISYSRETKCCVHDCSNPADFEVYLWDYYDYIDGGQEFFEQDYTCPFLCRPHMQENEKRAKGKRIPRGYVEYPFTNQHEAQGFTKYQPIEEAYPVIYTIPKDILPGSLITNVIEVNEELIAYLAKRPELLRDLHPRKFEQVIAEIFKNKGFDVELTPATRDGGFDVLAARKDPFGENLYLIECKRYSLTNKVGVEVVRGLYGNKVAKRATMGIIATTSYFTRDAVNFASPLQYELSLKDFDAVKMWLKK
jgi:restriction endonuclease Mrr